MKLHPNIDNILKNKSYTWLITGVAGFIGSNLLEYLLKFNQRVIGIDNFSTGYQRNLDCVREANPSQYKNYFEFIQGDITHLETCQQVVKQVDFVLHHASLNTVSDTEKSSIMNHSMNIRGFLNMLSASAGAGVRKFVYASSHAVYGDYPVLPKRETNIGNPLSSYAVTKLAEEYYAQVFSHRHQIDTIGLRYFNIFGQYQDPHSFYSPIILRWIASLLKREPVYMNGDGSTTGDFTHVQNVVQANLLAALIENPEANNQIYNIGTGIQTSLNELFLLIKTSLSISYDYVSCSELIYRDFSKTDIPHSLADISKAQALLGYNPKFSLREGLVACLPWYCSQYRMKEYLFFSES